MSTWHPLLAAVERSPGVWVMTDPHGFEYGLVELRRVGERELRYKATCRGEVIGWATSLRVACERVHKSFLRGHGPVGGAHANWGEDIPA